jgi:CBS domain containing-hemolysin-like protein
MPRKGDKVTIAEHEFTVVEMRGRRVTKVLVTPRPEPQATAVRGA